VLVLGLGLGLRLRLVLGLVLGLKLGLVLELVMKIGLVHRVSDHHRGRRLCSLESALSSRHSFIWKMLSSVWVYVGRPHSVGLAVVEVRGRVLPGELSCARLSAWWSHWPVC